MKSGFFNEQPCVRRASKHNKDVNAETMGAERSLLAGFLCQEQVFDRERAGLREEDDDLSLPGFRRRFEFDPVFGPNRSLRDRSLIDVPTR